MKAAIFDMDGTLLDSMGMWRDFTPVFVSGFDIDITPRLLTEIESLSFSRVVGYFCEKCAHQGFDEEKTLAHWVGVLAENYRSAVTVNNSIIKYLEKLKNEDIPCAVATLTEHHLCDDALAFHGITPYMKHILTCEDVGMVDKSRPDIFLEAARRLGADPCDCTVFEDSFYAAKTARDAGFNVIGVGSSAQRDPERLKTVCHCYINDFAELL